MEQEGSRDRCTRSSKCSDQEKAEAKQRQKWMNSSKKKKAIRILTMLNTLIAPERKERRIRCGVHLLTVLVLLPICKAIR